MLNHPCGRGRILSKIVESKEYAVVVMRSLLSDMKKPKNPMKLKIKEPAAPACQFTVRICYPKRCKKMVTESTLAIASNLPTALRPDGKDLVVMPAGAPGTGPVVKKAGRGTRQAGAGQAVVMGKGKKS